MCWVDPTGETCEGNLEKEHVVSESILKLLGPIRFNISGEHKHFGKGSYKLKMLCSRHNRALSDYDEEMRRFLSIWKNILTKSCDKDEFERNITYELDGNRIECWLAKTLVNSSFFHSIIEKDKTKR
jgi:stalled ribosome alternative rescue factor ArfA